MQWVVGQNRSVGNSGYKREMFLCHSVFKIYTKEGFTASFFHGVILKQWLISAALVSIEINFFMRELMWKTSSCYACTPEHIDAVRHECCSLHNAQLANLFFNYIALAFVEFCTHFHLHIMVVVHELLQCDCYSLMGTYQKAQESLHWFFLVTRQILTYFKVEWKKPPLAMNKWLKIHYLFTQNFLVTVLFKFETGCLFRFTLYLISWLLDQCENENQNIFVEYRTTSIYCTCKSQYYCISIMSANKLYINNCPGL